MCLLCHSGPMYSQVFCSQFFAVGSGSSIDFIDVSRSMMTTPVVQQRVRVVCWVIWLQGLTFLGILHGMGKKFVKELSLSRKKFLSPVISRNLTRRCQAWEGNNIEWPIWSWRYDTGSRITETQFALLLMLCGGRWQKCGLCVFKKIFLNRLAPAHFLLRFEYASSDHPCTLDKQQALGNFYSPFLPN